MAHALSSSGRRAFPGHCSSSSRRAAAFRPRLVRSGIAVRAAAVVDVGLDAYCCLGLAHCFKKNDEGKLEDVFVIEPLSATSLECMATGARTSFKLATGVSVADAAARNRSVLPEGFQAGVWCDKYEERLAAAVRTWQRAHAQDNLMDIVPLGKVRSNFNFSLDDKRVLNFDNVVDDDDNIKQDISIDVYGRAEKQERDDKMAAAARAAAAAPAAAAEEEEEEEEDDLDALLAG